MVVSHPCVAFPVLSHQSLSPFLTLSSVALVFLRLPLQRQTLSSHWCLWITISNKHQSLLQIKTLHLPRQGQPKYPKFSSFTTLFQSALCNDTNYKHSQHQHCHLHASLRQEMHSSGLSPLLPTRELKFPGRAVFHTSRTVGMTSLRRLAFVMLSKNHRKEDH